MRRPLLTVGEPTIEGLCRELSESHPSVGVFTSEGGAFFGGHGFSDEAKLRNYAGYSKFWDGGAVDRTRAKDGYQSIDNRRVAMHVQIQPDAATVFFSDPTAIDQGIVARILPVAPDTLQGTREWEEIPNSARQALAGFHATLTKLIQHELNIKHGTLNELELPALELTASARERWIEFYNDVERRLAPNGNLAQIRWFASKMPEHVARLAGTLRIYADSEAKMIDVREIKCGIAIVEHYAQEHLRLHGASKVNAKVIMAENLLRWLVQDYSPNNGQDVSLAEIIQFGPSASRVADVARELMDVLARHGWVEKLRKGAVVKGKKRRDAYRIKKVTFGENPC